VSLLAHLVHYLQDRTVSKLKRAVQSPFKKKQTGTGSGSVAVEFAPEAVKKAFAAYQSGHLSEAESLCRQVIRTLPRDFDALHLLGVIALNTGRPTEAAEILAMAADAKPDHAEACANWSTALAALGRHEEALKGFERAIALDAGRAEPYNNRGRSLQELNRLEPALESYERAIALNPGYVEAWLNRGLASQTLGRHDAAVESFDRAMKLQPQWDFLFGTWLHARMTVCDWSDASRNVALLGKKIERKEKAATPQILAISGSPELQRKAAHIWVQAKFPANDVLQAIARRPAQGKRRVAYFSADFHDHATSHLMAGLFEHHDKSRIELTAFSFGPDKQDAMRARVSAAFDRFIDIGDWSDEEAASHARKLGIDIAVDLKGFTQGSRTGLFALRAAPIQVGFVGYPGTLAAGYMDYLIADSTLIPEASRKFYSEKIAYLPYSYQPNDRQRAISEKIFTREGQGLPAKGFVFCCFNNNFKITPDMFSVWMRILGRVENSVLWLLEDNDRAAANLRKEAALRGIDERRLVFAQRMPAAEHLARHRLADLFLDTMPYNAHTTGSDALWTGLPMLTCIAGAFAGRVGASLLRAVHLPALIANTPQEYEALAIELASNPGKLGQIRQELVASRLSAPLFDIARYTKHLEAAYSKMHERYMAGLPADHIHVLQ
jgi:predicted O-linked N-acetylglucosamine transferase (SPINDLY family)